MISEPLCRRCGNSPKARTAAGKLLSYCSACNRARVREWAVADPAKARASGKASRTKHAAAVKVRKRAWYEKNSTRLAAGRKDYYQRNKHRWAEHRKRWLERNPDKKLRGQVARYGLDADGYRALLASQSGCCAICRKPPAGRFKRLSVDHDHDSGRVRGLLCSTCNFLLGMADDAPSLLLAAIEYLNRRTAEAS